MHVMSYFHKTKYEFWISTARNVRIFGFRESGLIKICSFSEGISACQKKKKNSYSHVDWCKFFTHIKSMNVHNFKMFEDTELKMMASRLLTFNGMTSPLNFIRIYKLVQKLIKGKYIHIVHIQTGRWSHKPIFFLWESKWAKRDFNG
jgi:hypothetical protein